MCGILGVLATDGRPPPAETVAGLVPMLAHRGPDDRGDASLGQAAFGYTRLSIIGLAEEAARQPALRGRQMLAFNGEIYNYRDLAARLRDEGIPAAGRSDTDTLFLALAHWGVERTLAAIDGMFAFAWYDAANGGLTLARDPLGEKPLYWAQARGRLWFASEIKVLLGSGEIDAAPNLARIDDYFYTAKVNGAATMFRDVREVEPGTVLRVEAGGEIRIRRYWDVMAAASERGSLDSLAEPFGRRLREAVASRRISDVPLGLLFSGGIDSNALADLLLEGAPDEDLRFYFADNANEAVSERPDAEATFGALEARYPGAGLTLRSRRLGMDAYLDELRRLTWHYDEPIQFYNSPLLGALCQAARDDGLKVLLSGEGSDEILYGYDRFARTARLIEGESEREARIAHFYYGGGLHSRDAVRDLTGAVAEGAEASEPWRWLDHHLDAASPDSLQLLYSQRYRLQMLLQRQDRIGMADGIEIRVPYLAPGFVRWVNALPTEAKYDAASGETKRLLRRAMRGRLPERILTKAKDGFPADIAVWLRTGELAGVLTDMVGDPNGFCQNHLDGAVARRLVAGHFDGTRRLDTLMWLLLSLETWHRVFAEGVPAAAPAATPRREARTA